MTDARKPAPPAAAGPAADLVAAAETTARARAAESERDRLAARVALIESSTAYQVGMVLVQGARRPATAPWTVPRDVYRLYRRWRGEGGQVSTSVGRADPPTGRRPPPAASPKARRGTGGSPAPRLAAGPPPEDLSRLLVRNSAHRVSPRDRPVLALVGPAATARALRPHADVQVLLPNDAVAVLEAAQPDLVLVDAAVARSGGPWAHLGTYAAPERDTALLGLLATARSSGVPVALWQSVPPEVTPMLSAAAGLFDVVLSARGDGHTPTWDRGVQLAEHNPIGLAERPPHAVLFAGDPYDDAGPFGGSSLLELLTGCRDLGLVLVPGPAGSGTLPDPLARAVPYDARRGRPADNRTALVTLATPFSAAAAAGLPVAVLEQLADGARVVAGPYPAAAGAGWTWVSSVGDPKEGVDTVARLAALGRRPPGESRRLLRVLFTDHAVPVRLAALLTHVGKPYEAPTRAISLLVEVTGADAADALVDSVARQLLRPSEILLTGPDEAVARAVRALSARGLTGEGIAGGAARDPRELARRARHPWVALRRTALPHPAHLLDLAIGVECSGADAVGYSDRDFAFPRTLELDRALVARDTLVADSAEGSGASGVLEAGSGRRLLALADVAGPTDPAGSS